MDSIESMDPALVEKAALVALLRRPGARWHDITSEVLDRGSAVHVLRSQLVDPGALFPAGNVDHEIQAGVDEILSWEAAGIDVHAFFEPSYPAQLRDIHQLPPLLFTRGVLGDDRRAVAVVGTRNASDRGLGIARTVAQTLAQSNITVVSGLAAGIDTAAHTAALEAGGRTVAVLGTGIERSYPAANKLLQERMGREGLLISQFWPDGPPTKKTFLMRNAVTSGYSLATVVIEAAWRSGARSQARLALQHGRSVVMPRELLEHDWARDYAERPGVHVVDSPDSLLAVVDQLVNEATSGLDDLQKLASIVHV